MLQTDGRVNGDIVLGELVGLRMSAGRSAVVGSLALWVLVGILRLRRARTDVRGAAVGGLLVVLMHWLFDLLHQLGHAGAAARAGYPMTGLRFWGVFSTGQYPQDEPDLPAAIHVQRALGGPAASLTLGLLAVPLALFGRRGSLLHHVGLFAAFDNLVVLGLGAFVPLGFTDGSTLLRWVPKLRDRAEGERAHLPTSVF